MREFYIVFGNNFPSHSHKAKRSRVSVGMMTEKQACEFSDSDAYQNFIKFVLETTAWQWVELLDDSELSKREHELFEGKK